jgi:hypothetical protein
LIAAITIDATTQITITTCIQIQKRGTGPDASASGVARVRAR